MKYDGTKSDVYYVSFGMYERILCCHRDISVDLDKEVAILKTEAKICKTD